MVAPVELAEAQQVELAEKYTSATADQAAEKYTSAPPQHKEHHKPDYQLERRPADCQQNNYPNRDRRVNQISLYYLRLYY
jgi:hypothetical protein